MAKHGLEFRTAGGSPEDQHWVDELRAAESKKGPDDVLEISKELRAVYDRVDFKELKAILESMSRRSGVPPEELGFLGPDRLAAAPFGRQTQQDGFAGRIYLSEKEIRDWASKAKSDWELCALHVLIHEETHAVSKQECVGLREYLANEQASTYSISGYSRLSHYRRDGKEPSSFSYEFFDEGVTDLIAQEVVKEYLYRHPEFAFPEKANRFFKRSFNQGISPRESYVKIVRLIEQVISERTGVGTDIVHGAIIRGKMSGDDLNDPELHEALSEILTPDVLTELENLTLITTIDFERLSEKLKRLLDAPESKQVQEQLAARWAQQ